VQLGIALWHYGVIGGFSNSKITKRDNLTPNLTFLTLKLGQGQIWWNQKIGHGHIMGGCSHVLMFKYGYLRHNEAFSIQNVNFG